VTSPPPQPNPRVDTSLFSRAQQSKETPPWLFRKPLNAPFIALWTETDFDDRPLIALKLICKVEMKDNLA
jgi:hypothetical protein